MISKGQSRQASPGRTGVWQRVLGVGLLVALGAIPAMSSARPDNPQAEGPQASISGTPGRNGLGEVVLPVAMDISGVEVKGQPAVLGAYVFSVRFDPQKLEFVDVGGGETPQFREKPVFTLPGRANASGLLKVTSEQLDQQEPTGLVRVAVVRFREKAQGGLETLDLRIENLASAMRSGSATDPGHLPQSLPFRDSHKSDSPKEETRKQN